ncbi:MAG: hypothetical protein LBP69_09825 [Treponema sp.]|jgi:hypothetical protein|nr:hypothetical protein [Treponema sp.]
MEEAEIKNAVITGAEMSNQDHGVLTGWLSLDYGGEGQAFGGLALYLPKSFTHHRIDSFAGHWIFRVMEIAGVARWEDLAGKAIRVKATNTKVCEIGHIVKDDWFNPEKDFAPYIRREEEDV